MDGLRQLIGREQPLDMIPRRLKDVALSEHPTIVGAHHITCSDETEREALDVFSDVFVKPLLPTLKLSQQSAFRTANLGSQYEWGSIRIAEHHFATNETERGSKLMVLKINAHVSRENTASGMLYGRMDRYNETSDCCGALFGLMRGNSLPSIERIREVFEWEGTDRLGALGNQEHIPDEHRGLVAAIVQARLQARVAMADIRDHHPHSPTLYLVVPSVTINIPELDHEILVGLYSVDLRNAEEDGTFTYVGLGDDPSQYKIVHKGFKVEITDMDSDQERPARDHRQVPLRHWLEHSAKDAAQPPGGGDLSCGDAGLEKELDALFGEAPVEGALRLFAAGHIPIHQVFTADRLSRDPEASYEARHLFDEARWSFDGLAKEGLKEMRGEVRRIRDELSR